jgi:hypothetical protein
MAAVIQHRVSSVSVQLYPPEPFSLSAPRPSYIPETVQPFVSEPRHLRLSPNKTPIVEEELLSTPERHIYPQVFLHRNDAPFAHSTNLAACRDTKTYWFFGRFAAS